jgi:hypothetical protein
VSNYDELEAEVRADLARDKLYPWGEPDMRRWAVAFRLSLESNQRAIDDEMMFAWFANVAAMGEVAYAGAPAINADGVQSVIDGECVDPSIYFKRWRGEPVGA